MKTLKSCILLSVSFLFMILSCQSPDNDQGEQNNEIVVPVEARIIDIKNIEQIVPVAGMLVPIHQVDLISEVSGKIIKINKKLGSAVSLTDTIAVIDDKVARSNYEQAKAQVLSAKNNLEIAQLNLSSDKTLFQNGDISKLDYENSILAMKNARANLKSAQANLTLMKKAFFDTRIVSPIAGIISREFIDIGSMANPGTPLFRIVDIATLKAQVGMPQSVISSVRKGNKVDIIIAALNDEKFEGNVRYVSPQADERTGAFTVEIHVDNTKDKKIRAGMTAQFSLLLTEQNKKLAIPDYALVNKNGNEFVYKINKDRAILTGIDIAETIGGNLVVGSGLSAGDTIVTVGMKNLGENTKVKLETVYN